MIAVKKQIEPLTTHIYIINKEGKRPKNLVIAPIAESTATQS
jgi:hypothetical protein